MPEQLAFHEFFGDGSAIQRNEVRFGTRRLKVQRLRDQLFAGAGLTMDQHRRCRVRYRLDQLAYLSHRRAVANDGIRLSHQVEILGGR
jgi:hypothetical protein